MDQPDKAFVAGLSRTQRDAIETLQWAMEHFGALITNRHVTRRTVVQLVNKGVAESIGQCIMCDGDGFTLYPERYREGFRLTEFGVRCHAVLMEHYESFMCKESADKLKVGDDVEVLDEGLAMLRSIAPDQPPNHHGRIESIDGDTIMVEFPIDGSYEHSQLAPYPRSKIRIRSNVPGGS